MQIDILNSPRSDATPRTSRCQDIQVAEPTGGGWLWVRVLPGEAWKSPFLDLRVTGYPSLAFELTGHVAENTRHALPCEPEIKCALDDRAALQPGPMLIMYLRGSPNTIVSICFRKSVITCMSWPSTANPNS